MCFSLDDLINIKHNVISCVLDLEVDTSFRPCFKSPKGSLLNGPKGIFLLGIEGLKETHSVLSSFLFTIKIVINQVLALDYNGLI